MSDPPDASSSDEVLGASEVTRREVAITVASGPGAGRRAVLRDISEEAALPARIGRFVIEARLGVGGMGVVYKAEDRQLGRKIAIKLLRVAPSQVPDDGGEGAMRLLREAQALARLDHPNVVAVHEVGVLADEVFVAMEFIEGETLRKWMARGGPRPWQEVTRAFVQAGRGLAAAHHADLVHRDFKPENAMIDVHGRVRVLDFGLARAAGLGAPSSLIARILHSGAPGPQTSMVAGTPPYMAPEQHLGLPCDARSDQFGFCVAFYEALFGVRPFPDGDPAHRFQALMAGELRRPVKPPKVPGWLRAALVRGLAPVPGRRHPSMDALLHAITEAPRIRRRRLVAAAIVVLLGIATGLGFSLWVETRDVCSKHADRVAELWASQRGPLQAAITGSGAPYADAAWASLDASMHARARRWREMYRASCSAHSRAAPEHEQALLAPLICLSGQAREISAMLTVLSEEPDAARHAVKVEGELAPVSACGAALGLPAWARRADVDEALRGEAIGQTLAEIKTAGELGHYKPALARATTLLAVAREFGEPSLVARTLLRIGALQRHLADYASAAVTLEEAHWTALGAGADDVAARAASSLMLIHGYHHNDRERGRLWERSAAALLLRAPERPRTTAGFYNNRAIVRTREGRHAEAEADYRRALEIYAEGDVGESDLQIARVLGNMSRVEFMRGDLTAAAANLERSLELRQRRGGKEHPEVAITMSNLAIVLTELGDLEPAATLLRRALVIEETLHGPRHVKLAPTLDNLAKVLARQSRWDDAGQLSQRALALVNASERPDPSMKADVHLGIGATLALQGRFDEAVPELREAVALRHQDRGAEHPDTAQARAELAEVLLLANRAEAGAQASRFALPKVEDLPSSAVSAASAPLLALRGRVLLARGLTELGEPLLVKVLPQLPAPLARGRARAALARLQAGRGEPGAAAMAAAAEADLRAAGAGFERERLEVAALRVDQPRPE